jgi:replicative DNA helicase
MVGDGVAPYEERDATPWFIADAEVAECDLLGAILSVTGRDGVDVGAIARIVTEPEFLQPRNGEVWEAILRVYGRGETPTAALVYSELGGAAHKLPGGAGYLHTLMSRPGILPYQAPAYAAKVHEHYVRRSIGDMGARAMQLRNDPDTTVEQFLSGLAVWSDRFADNLSTGTTDVRTALESVIDVAQHGQRFGIPTPWPSLDELLGGMSPGQLLVVAARPGVGKSLFAENVCSDVARYDDLEALFVSLEMTAAEITTRTLAHTAKVDLRRLRAGKAALSEDDWTRIRKAVPTIEAQHITYADRKGQTLLDIRSAAHTARQKARRAGRRLGVVAVDYAGLVEGRDPKMPRHLMIGEVTRGLKKLAGELETTVLLLSQLNRNGDGRTNKIPLLSDLRESGSLEQDADAVIFLHEPEDGADGDLEFHVAKQRNGPTGVRTMRKYGYLARISEGASYPPALRTA